MPKPSEYIWIKKWGQMAGSLAYYIEDEQGRAADDDAPLNAIYRDLGPGGKPGRWRTTDDITVATTRAALGLDPIKETK